MKYSDAFSGLPERVERADVVQVQQQHRWDCGLACVLMVVPEETRRHFLANFESICEQEQFGHSVWSIDLAYLLHRFGIELQYCTVTAGIDPGYSTQSFYGYGRTLRLDSGRVTERFAGAAGRGISVEVRSVAADELARHLALYGPAIVLVDSRYLRCELCHANKVGSELANCFPCASDFRGHYIVLFGYDLKRAVFLYRNPTFKDRSCCLSLAALDECRLSYGTDEDTILIHSRHSR